VGDDHELRLDAHFLDEVGEAADVGFVEDAERAGRELEDGGRVAEPLISAGTTTDAGVPRLFKFDLFDSVRTKGAPSLRFCKGGRLRCRRDVFCSTNSSTPTLFAQNAKGWGTLCLGCVSEIKSLGDRQKNGESVV